MPHDRFKSAIYKSLVICDDPKGVVECGSIRKLKNAAQQMEHKADVVKPLKNVNKSSHKSTKVEAGQVVSEQVTEEDHSPSTSQLLEIAKGAQRLNQMINSWSKGLGASSRPKYIGNDLLKGAVDLQESLSVLAKLQEASRHTVKSNGRRNASERGSSGKLANEGDDLQSYRDEVYSGFERPRLSADDSSQRCADDLKDLIKNSLFRQYVLEEKSSTQYNFQQRNVELTSEIPSTSSSQSSTAQNDIFGSVDSSTSSVVPQNMIDGPNLIARLMGIEKMPSEQIQTYLQKQWENERVLSWQKPAVDIDMPRLRESYHGAAKVVPEMRTVRQTHEKILSKGILKDNSSKRSKAHSHKPSNLSSEEKLKYEGSPIVLLKPGHVSGSVSGGSLVSALGNKETFGTRSTVKKLIMKGRSPDEGANYKDQNLSTRKVENLNTMETPFSLVDNLENKETLIERVTWEERTCDFRSLPNKPVAREVKATEMAPNKMKAYGRIIHDTKDFVNEKRAVKIQKAKVTHKKTSEKDPLKLKYTSRPQDKPKISNIKQRNSENGSKIPKNQVPSRHGITPDSISKNMSAFHNTPNQKKNQKKGKKSVAHSTAAISTTNNLRHKNCDKKIDCPPQNCIVPTSTAGRVSQAISTEDIESTKLGSEEHGNEQHQPSYICGGLVEIIGNDENSNSCEASEICITTIVKSGQKTEFGSHFKSLLLTNPSFLGHVEEYFDPNTNCPTMSRVAGIEDCDSTSDRLLLDYANELVNHKTHPNAYITNPLSLSHVYSWKISLCIDQLLQEVCDGIDFLGSFCKLLGEDLHVDGIYAMLKKDIMSKDSVNGNWDMGWRNGFSVDDAEEIVSLMEKSVLSELLDEIFS